MYIDFNSYGYWLWPSQQSFADLPRSSSPWGASSVHDLPQFTQPISFTIVSPLSSSLSILSNPDWYQHLIVSLRMHWQPTNRNLCYHQPWLSQSLCHIFLLVQSGSRISCCSSSQLHWLFVQWYEWLWVATSIVDSSNCRLKCCSSIMHILTLCQPHSSRYYSAAIQLRALIFHHPVTGLPSVS